MPIVRLVHWKASELGERVLRLERAGYDVKAWGAVDGAGFLRALREDPPVAVVIDLSRIPSHGREVGVALRTQKATRAIPLVFVGGEAEKIRRVQAVLPDAVYTTWRGIRGALGRAIRHPPKDPVDPGHRMAAYAKTPLVKKLGIRPGMRVALLDAPEAFEDVLVGLGPDVTLRRDARAKTDLTLWFVRRRKDLEAHVAKRVRRSEKGGLWIAWPKKASKLATDVDQRVVREVGMNAGMVDFKICAIDETWSGLRFTRREGPSGSR